MSADHDLAIVGGGPAGMSCAIAAHSLGLRTVLFERMALGGELATLTTVSELPGRRGVSGPDLAADLMEDLLDTDTVIEYAEVESLSREGDVWTLNGTARAGAVVLATGVEPDLDRLPGARERAGRGVSSCSSCDGPLFKGKRVAVVGDGEHAARMALELGVFATAVTVVVDGDLGVSRGTRDLLDSQPSIEVRTATSVTGFEGTPVDGLVLHGPDGNLALEVEGVFVGLPRVADSRLLDQVAATADGRCVVDAVHRAATEGPPLFAIGDVRSGSSGTVAGSMGDGVAVAWAAARALAGVVA